MKNDTDANYDKLVEMLEDLHGEEVIRVFCNWHGTRLLTDDFIADVREQYGYDDEEEEEEDDE